MKNKILSIVGILWGGGIILRWLLSNSSDSGGAYQTGQGFAVILGVFILGISLYNFFKKPKEKENKRYK
ncbi:MAG: hypothetical protein RLN81_05080 [Balneolaceae bacterium]